MCHVHIDKEDGSFDLVVVDNTSAPAIPAQGVMEALA